MSVNLKKENIRLSEVICTHSCQTTREWDVIVPDIKPDVAKVLRISGDAAITQKSIQMGKVYVQGVVRLDILYIPDGNVLGKIKSISTVQEFDHYIDAKGADPGMNLVAEVDCDSPEFTLVNSRKLSVRARLGISIKVTAAREISVATSIEGSEKVQTKTKHLRINNSCCEADRDIIIRQRLDVPSGKPDLGEILKFSVKPLQCDLRLIDNKAIVKGELNVCTLYCSEDSEASVQCMEHTVPFTEILEIDGISEGMAGETDFSTKDIYYEICRDADGDKRVLSFELTLCACVRTSEIVELDALGDAYGLCAEIQIEKELCTMEQLIETSKAQITQKEEVLVPDYLPELFQMCECTAVPTIENISIEGRAVCVSGFLSLNLLYLSEDSGAPISGFGHVLPFTHTFAIPDITENSLCDAKVDMDHISYAINSPRSLEIRTILTLCLKAVNPSGHELISAINYDENQCPPKMPSMVIYFVKKGDSLWEIAKRYRTTEDAIINANGAEKDFMKEGNRIYIFR